MHHKYLVIWSARCLSSHKTFHFASMAALPPDSYELLYGSRGDDLGGLYDPLYTKYDDPTVTPLQMHHAVVLARSDTGAPKVYALLADQDGSLQISTVHRVTRFAGHPGLTSRHDNYPYAFRGDKTPSSKYVDMTSFPIDFITREAYGNRNGIRKIKPQRGLNYPHFEYFFQSRNIFF